MSEQLRKERARDTALAKLHLLTEMIMVMAKIMEPETELLDSEVGAGVIEDVTAFGEKEPPDWARFKQDGSHYFIMRWKTPALILPLEPDRTRLGGRA